MAFFMVTMLYGTVSRHKTLCEGLKKYNEVIAYSVDRGKAAMIAQFISGCLMNMRTQV